MAEETTTLALLIIGIAVLMFYLYITSIQKVFERIGFTKGEAGAILGITIVLGWISIPLFKYNGWWVGINVGGGLIPLIICAILLRSKRVNIAELTMGVIIAAYATYFVTRAEENVGIVADLPLAFAPALAAGFFSMSTFWSDLSKAAPLAYTSGVLGTLIGADVFHLGEMLSFTPPVGETVLLSVGGANILDMVYLTGIVAVGVDIMVFWIKKQESRHGFGAVVSEFGKGAEGLPYARDVVPAPKLEPGRKGRL